MHAAETVSTLLDAEIDPGYTDSGMTSLVQAFEIGQAKAMLATVLLINLTTESFHALFGKAKGSHACIHTP